MATNPFEPVSEIFCESDYSQKNEQLYYIEPPESHTTRRTEHFASLGSIGYDDDGTVNAVIHVVTLTEFRDVRAQEFHVVEMQEFHVDLTAVNNNRTRMRAIVVYIMIILIVGCIVGGCVMLVISTNDSMSRAGIVIMTGVPAVLLFICSCLYC
jgi:hypothetical protein